MNISLNKKEVAMLLTSLWKSQTEIEQKLRKNPEAKAYQKAYEAISKTTYKFEKAWGKYKR